MSRTTTIARKMRQRRAEAEFFRALRYASPSMQQELIAAAAHQNLNAR